MKQQDAQQLGGFWMPPSFNTSNEVQDPSYNKMQMVAQWRNHDNEAMVDKRGIGYRQEAAVKQKAINIILLCENSHRHIAEEVWSIPIGSDDTLYSFKKALADAWRFLLHQVTIDIHIQPANLQRQNWHKTKRQ